MDFGSAILQNDVTQPGGKPVRGFETGIRRNDLKRRDLLIRDLSLATEAMRSFIFWKTRLRRDAATNARDAYAILHGLLELRFGQWQGSLAKNVSPACRSANISVAKP